MPRVLVVDDEQGVRESLRMLFKGDCEVATAGSVEEAERVLQESTPDLILLDLVMPGRSGLDLLAALADEADPPPVVVLTATKTVNTAVEAMKRGAVDYITKPFEVEALRIKVRSLLERRELEREVVRLRAEADERERLCGLVGASPPMRELFQTIRRIAASRATVLIQGESGTGKELVARAIHDLGERAEQPFVAVNCAALPDPLIESELFGHERGAFTDARERRIGKFETAAGGTLFLDEIGELGISVQAKLLRALQEKQIERLGGSAPIEVDVRVVAATNRDLEADVAEGRFRSDLFYRINVVPIALPALAERREDIRRLAEHFLAAAREEADRGPSRIARGAIAALERYTWPGNVRELENAIARAVALAEGEVLELGDLPPAIVRASELETLGESVRTGQLGFDAALGNFEKTLIVEALARADGNQTRAAEQLQITRRSLKLKMDRYGIEPS
ncbi:MAG: sigma-54-dependent Fis family transcriptional regulator [Deltaproteobacteria bacterium]|jgi:DNA-binding NtrC family response regulator|nr:sigma-54-dependent Fis family transcriptional regulator [Deltaproteobacteria bacterium]